MVIQLGMVKEKVKFFTLRVEIFSLTNNKEMPLVLFAVLISAGIIASLSVNRNFYTYGTETDYLCSLTEEATRLLNGEPLQLYNHPPFYSATIAFVQYVVQDWFATGLIVSWVSAIIVLITSYIFFFQLWGSFAAWGSLAALIAPGIFISYSAQASTDIFFLALYCLGFFFALQAMRTKKNLYWMLTGLTAGLTTLTRSNGFTVIFLLIFPWFQYFSLRHRLINFIWISIGLIAPVFCWILFASMTNSRLYPSGNYLNLAMTYFTEDRIAGEAMAKVKEMGFQNAFQVIAHDPVHIAKTYVRDFLNMIWLNFRGNRLVMFPINLLALPGILLLCYKSNRTFIFLCLLSTLLQIGIINFKAYEPRFFLFLVPIFGAGAGLCFQKILEEVNFRNIRPIIFLFLIPFIVIGFYRSYPKVYNRLHSQDELFRELLPEVEKLSTQEGNIVSRKICHLSYYTNFRPLPMPMVSTEEDLGEFFQVTYNGSPIYLLFGSAEKKSRPALKYLIYPEKSPEWLKPVVRSKKTGAWVLYQYLPEKQKE